MAKGEFKRKLTAVFSADVVGYSRLMGEDEVATVKTLEAYKGVIFTLIKQYRGRVVDSPGDNLLADFGSVVDAVQCAVAVQKELQARNFDLPEDRKMQFRIGINLGDVIEEKERLYGDGVNIAARLEALADPGRICVSKTAFDHIESKLPLGYKFIGEQAVKNIAKPVGAYKILMETRVVDESETEKLIRPPLWRRKAVLSIGALVVLALIAGLVWNFYFRPPPIEAVSKEKTAFELPDKPSIAVLPFLNLSEDKSQEFFSDGLTEEIITALSKVPMLFVIARNSSFVYKGKRLNIQQVGRELGVKYILEGSVRKSGNEVRITAQLIDAMTGNHLWAERYELELKNIFAVQDEVTIKIISSVTGRAASTAETTSWISKAASNLDAYLKYMEGIVMLLRSNRVDTALAGKKLEEAIALEPKWAPPYAALGIVYGYDFRFSHDPEFLKKAYEYAQKAISLDDTQLYAYLSLATVYEFQRRYEEAITVSEKAIKIAPGSADAYFSLGLSLLIASREKEAMVYFKKALRMNPFPPSFWLSSMGTDNYFLGNYKEAAAAYKKALSITPENQFARFGLIVTYVEMGRLEEARAEAKELLMKDPKWNYKTWLKTAPWKDPKATQRWAEAIKKVGLN